MQLGSGRSPDENGAGGNIPGAYEVGEVFTRPAPVVSCEEAIRIAKREYGLEGTARRLVGERDQNFLLDCGPRGAFMLKVAHPAEDRMVADFQTSVLLHIEQSDPSLPVQRIRRTRSGAGSPLVTSEDGAQRTIRLTTFLPGRIVRGLPSDATRARRLGEMLARIQVALETFEHAADSHPLVWDLKNTSWQRSVVDELGGDERRRLLKSGLDRFDENVRDRLPLLRSQVVHNDLSGDNVVVSEADAATITGVLDFGDAVRTAAINDLAIAIAYSLVDDEDIVATATPLIEGFSSVKPVSGEEVSLLLDLVIARMVVRVGITEWRARRFPENKAYILRSTEMTWRLLDRLLRLPQDHARTEFQRASDRETRT